MQWYILPVQAQAVESQEALQRRHCAASRIAATWHGRQSRLQMRQLLRTRERANKDCAASAIQVTRANILVIMTPLLPILPLHDQISAVAWPGVHFI